MILTKDKLDELAKEKANEKLLDVETKVADALVHAKYENLNHLDLVASSEYPWWALEKVGKKYEEVGYNVTYHNISPYNFPYSSITIIVDDEGYEEEERKNREWMERYRVIQDKKWWEFWK